MDVLLFLLFLKELFYFFYFFFLLFHWEFDRVGGVRTSRIFGKFKFRKKIQVQFFFAIFLVTSLWLQSDSRAKWTYRFFKKSWPLFWRSHSFLRKSSYLFTDIFKDNLDIVENNRKKINFPPWNHYFGVFHIDYYPMHYSITKKHTLSLHVKNIDIKNYAINSATAAVRVTQRGITPGPDDPLQV